MQKDKFLQWIGEHWEQQQDKLKRYCSNKHLDFDTDVFSETVLKVAEKIQKNGIEDCSESGMDKYFFKSSVQNIRRELQYSRNARRDYNVTEVGELYEDYANAHFSTAQEKLLSDLRKDFSTIYILSKVESQYGSSLCRLFTEKFYIGHTYKDLSKRYPEFKKLRDKLLDMKRWAISNISREEIDAAFNAEYADILE